MTTPLPPDPYAALGVLKTATLTEIRSSHRKLVLKCHPDKVQDPALKAIKQDEFQKVQQAYELLSDDKRRSDYDDSVKLAQLRKEMGHLRTNAAPPPSRNPYEPEVRREEVRRDANVRTAEPRESTFKPTRPREPEAKMYRQTPSRSEEDHINRVYAYPDDILPDRSRRPKSYEEHPRSAKVPREASFREASSKDSRERDRDDERRREKKEDERHAKEAKAVKDLKDAFKKKKDKEQKARDTEKKRGKEEKTSRTTRAFVVDASTDESDREYRLKQERKAARRAMEEEEDARAAKAERSSRRKKDDSDAEPQTERTRKAKAHASNAVQYLQASIQKSASSKAARKIVDPEDPFRPSMLASQGRSQTFQEKPSYSSKYAYEDDEDQVHRSRAQRTPRRASEQIPEPSSRTRESRDSRESREARDLPIRSSREEKRSYDAPRSPVIVDAAPSSFARPPSMPVHSSSPASLGDMLPRKEAHRASTMPYVQPQSPSRAHPPMARGATFTEGSTRDAPKPSRTSSRLKNPVLYTESESESDDVRQTSSPRDMSPPPRRRPAMPTTTSYKVSKEGVIPSTKYVPQEHRSSLREEDEYDRERSRSREGPQRRSPERSERRSERPVLPRNPSGSKRQASSTRAVPQYYEEPAPIIKEGGRPKLSPRETSYRANYFDNVTYATHGPVQYADAYTSKRGSGGEQNTWDSNAGYSYSREPQRARA